MKEKINEIICRHSSVQASELTEELSLVTAAGISSFELVLSIVEIEEEFHIQISDHVLESFRTMGDLYSYVESHAKV